MQCFLNVSKFMSCCQAKCLYECCILPICYLFFIIALCNIVMSVSIIMLNVHSLIWYIITFIYLRNNLHIFCNFNGFIAQTWSFIHSNSKVMFCNYTISIISFPMSVTNRDLSFKAYNGFLYRWIHFAIDKNIIHINLVGHFDLLILNSLIHDMKAVDYLSYFTLNVDLSTWKSQKNAFLFLLDDQYFSGKNIFL